MSIAYREKRGSASVFSRHFHDHHPVPEAGYLAEALAAQDVAHAVAIHKSAFFAEKDTAGNRIDYMEAVRAGLTLLPSGTGYDALRHDYQHMISKRMDFLFEDAEPFELLMTKSAPEFKRS